MRRSSLFFYNFQFGTTSAYEIRLAIFIQASTLPFTNKVRPLKMKQINPVNRLPLWPCIRTILLGQAARVQPRLLPSTGEIYIFKKIVNDCTLSHAGRPCIIDFMTQRLGPGWNLNTGHNRPPDLTLDTPDINKWFFSHIWLSCVKAADFRTHWLKYLFPWMELCTKSSSACWVSNPQALLGLCMYVVSLWCVLQ